MMTPKFSVPVNRLAHRVGKGVTRNEAVKRAEANIESIRDDGLANIDARITQLNETFAAPVANSAETIAALYETANAIAGTAAVFGLKALGSASYSLCDLLVRFEQNGVWNPSAVKLHLDGMRICRQLPAGKSAGAEPILANLARLVSHVAPKAEAAPAEAKPA
jgi:hypothetical protein